MPDVNVLLYAINLDAPQCNAAQRWLKTAFDGPDGIGFAWPALTGFLRLSTKVELLRAPLSIATALDVIDEWLAHPRARILVAGERHSPLLARLLMGAGRGGNLVSDAHLAAIAIEHGATLGSFDGDFERFAGLHFDHLTVHSVHDG